MATTFIITKFFGQCRLGSYAASSQRPLYAITREDHPTSRGQPLSPNTRTVVTREEDETVRSLPLTNTHIDTQHTEYWHGARTPALE